MAYTFNPFEDNELVWWKKKLYQKQDWLVLWDRFFQIDELLFKDISLTTAISHILAIKVKWDFGIEVEIPFSVAPPPEMPEWLKQTRYPTYQKAVYGKSTYGTSYYDPEQWREAVKKLFFYAITQGYRYTTGTNEYKGFGKGEIIREGISFDKLSRVSMLVYVITEAPFCGFVIPGLTKIAPCYKKEGTWVTKIGVTTPEGYAFETEVSYIWEISHGHICGISACGISRAVGYRGIKPKPIVPIEAADWIFKDVRFQHARFIANLTAMKLPRAPTLQKTTWTEEYARWTTLVKLCERRLRAYLEKRGIDPMQINAYLDFLRELLFGRVKKHRPGKRGFVYLYEEKFLNYLIGKYVRMGLNEKILREIIDLFIDVARHVWQQRL